MSDPDPQGRRAARPDGRPNPSDALRDLLDAHGASERRCVELCPICRAADILRSSATPELREGLHNLQREALLTMKALIDAYVERLDDEPERGPRVHDIPIS